MQLELADRAQIEDLYARYVHTLDGGDAAGWADLFVPDGHFVYRGRPPVTVIGTDALREFLAARHAEVPGMRHFMANRLLEVTAHGVRGRSYAIVLRLAGDGALRVHTVGGYEDELARHSDGWRFRERRFEPWLPEELAGAAFEFVAGVDAP